MHAHQLSSTQLHVCVITVITQSAERPEAMLPHCPPDATRQPPDAAYVARASSAMLGMGLVTRLPRAVLGRC